MTLICLGLKILWFVARSHSVKKKGRDKGVSRETKRVVLKGVANVIFYLLVTVGVAYGAYSVGTYSNRDIVTTGKDIKIVSNPLYHYEIEASSQMKFAAASNDYFVFDNGEGDVVVPRRAEETPLGWNEYTKGTGYYTVKDIEIPAGQWRLIKGNCAFWISSDGAVKVTASLDSETASNIWVVVVFFALVIWLVVMYITYKVLKIFD